MALIKLHNQFIQIIIREVRVSESADCYLNAHVDSLLFIFFFLIRYSFSVLESVLKRIRSLQEIKIVSSFIYIVSQFIQFFKFNNKI